MEIIGTIIVGLIAGIIAKLLMPGKDPGGCIITILLGIAGAFVATYLGKFLGIYEPGETAGFFGAIIGAVIILWLYRIFLKKKE
ncbi:MAG: GlsB/YeaQ/YmgE family stress response membrane protein [Ignavibacteria bacterium]|nr:GlsB/YeaQ/YmgE family stress response membrane protein [Ignavibacteria bacterium]